MVEKFIKKDAKKNHFADRMEFRKKSNIQCCLRSAKLGALTRCNAKLFSIVGINRALAAALVAFVIHKGNERGLKDEDGFNEKMSIKF